MMGSVLNVLTCWYLWEIQAEMAGKQLAVAMSLGSCDD